MTDTDEWPIFRPKFGQRTKSSEARGQSFRHALLTGARLRSGGTLGRVRRVLGRLRVAAPPPGALSRRAIVKAHIVRMGRYGARAAALHLRYIERAGVALDGGPAQLYGPDGLERADTFRAPRVGETHQFRWIVSPEDGRDLDLTRYVRDLMAQVERDTGRRLDWAAVNHFDTDHPHAHIVIRGLDRDGRELRFDRAYIAHGVRRRAQELATRELGLRTEFDLARQRSREITQDRCTSLDRALERRAIDHVVTIRRSAGQRSRPPRWGAVDPAMLRARLEHLEQLRLAERLSRDAWQLADDFTGQLRALGARNDIIQQMHKALRGDPSRYRILGPDEALPGFPSVGPASESNAVPPGGEQALSSDPSPSHPSTSVLARIVQKGLADELRGSFYAVVETANGIAVHLPLDPRSAETLREGELVRLSTSLPAGRGDGEPRPVLAREPLDLEAQVDAPGPVPLDAIERDTLAHWGLGADVRRALDRREHTLVRFGIDSADPERIRMLVDRSRGLDLDLELQRDR